MDGNPPGSSFPWDFPGKKLELEQVAISFSRGVFLTQGLNPYLLHWQVDSLPLSHQGSLIRFLEFINWLSFFTMLFFGFLSFLFFFFKFYGMLSTVPIILRIKQNPSSFGYPRTPIGPCLLQRIETLPLFVSCSSLVPSLCMSSWAPWEVVWYCGKLQEFGITRIRSKLVSST